MNVAGLPGRKNCIKSVLRTALFPALIFLAFSISGTLRTLLFIHCIAAVRTAAGKVTLCACSTAVRTADGNKEFSARLTDLCIFGNFRTAIFTKKFRLLSIFHKFPVCVLKVSPSVLHPANRCLSLTLTLHPDFYFHHNFYSPQKENRTYTAQNRRYLK